MIYCERTSSLSLKNLVTEIVWATLLHTYYSGSTQRKTFKENGKRHCHKLKVL